MTNNAAYAICESQGRPSAPAAWHRWSSTPQPRDCRWP